MIGFLLLLGIPYASLADKLHIDLLFEKPEYVPPVVVVYWPQDRGLHHSPVMDHKEGMFTHKLILGNRGDQLSLRNSDDVGHTIYVKDKRQKVQWRLQYMPPGSAFLQELYWGEDVFVELKCRLHLYMSSWVGSITTRYYKVVELHPDKVQWSFEMNDFPDEFSEVKVWMPKLKAVHTELLQSDSKSFELKKSSRVKGKITLTRSG